MFDYLKRNQLKISLALTLITLVIVLMTQVSLPGVRNWFSSVTHTLAYPFQQTSHFIYSEVKGFWNGYIWLINTKTENDRLIRINRELREENQKYYEIALSYNRLRKSLEFKESNPDKKIFAEVIGESSEGFNRLLTINRGSSDEVFLNYAVIAPEGIVGKIISTTPFQSTVLLITDNSSQIPVLIQRSRTKAILTGSPEGDLFLTLVPRTADLMIGDRIVASGLAGIFPKGLLVGTIETIEKKNYGLFQSALVKPTVDFLRTEEVFVIFDSQENIQKPLFTE